MKDSTRESLSYFGLYRKMFQAKKLVQPELVGHKTNYFLYYEPKKVCSDQIIVWIHGGGWNAGSPGFFDFVGQCAAGEGYRFVSLGYRLSPKHKYPSQIEDVCNGYKGAMTYLREVKKIDTDKVIVAGPSAGAHLASLLCYDEQVQKTYGVDVSNVKGFIGSGGPYSFQAQPLAVRMLLNQLFAKGYDRAQAEPCQVMAKSGIPALLIQSEHDGLIPFSCAVRFQEKARELGNDCELYRVVDRKNTHSWYTAGMFLETREENQGLDKFFSWIEERET